MVLIRLLGFFRVNFNRAIFLFKVCISLFRALAREAEPDSTLTFEQERHPALGVVDWKLVSK